MPITDGSFVELHICVVVNQSMLTKYRRIIYEFRTTNQIHEKSKF